jgi:hypothetical protein
MIDLAFGIALGEPTVMVALVIALGLGIRSGLELAAGVRARFQRLRLN